MRRSKAVKTDAIRSFTLLFILKWYRNKIGLTALSMLLLVAPIASASPKQFDQDFSYKAKLGRDQDGDHIPETATIRQRGSFYRVCIPVSLSSYGTVDDHSDPRSLLAIF